jgi:hypothetical protein
LVELRQQLITCSSPAALRTMSTGVSASSHSGALPETGLVQRSFRGPHSFVDLDGAANPNASKEKPSGDRLRPSARSRGLLIGLRRLSGDQVGGAITLGSQCKSYTNSLPRWLTESADAEEEARAVLATMRIRA